MPNNKIYFYNCKLIYNHSIIQIMAQVFQTNVYQINSLDSIPLPQVVKYGFPSAGVMIRTALDQYGNAGMLMSNGVRAYGMINLLANGSVYYTSDSQSALVTLANA